MHNTIRRQSSVRWEPVSWFLSLDTPLPLKTIVIFLWYTFSPFTIAGTQRTVSRYQNFRFTTGVHDASLRPSTRLNYEIARGVASYHDRKCRQRPDERTYMLRGRTSFGENRTLSLAFTRLPIRCWELAGAVWWKQCKQSFERRYSILAIKNYFFKMFCPTFF